MIIPGSLTRPGALRAVYIERQLKRNSRGKYRHIASYKLVDLRWDGSLYLSSTPNGEAVPFIQSFDSDSEEEYEPINIQRGKREGTIGFSDAQIGLYISVPGAGDNGERRLTQIQKKWTIRKIND
jgi:hypothetical protein